MKQLFLQIILFGIISYVQAKTKCTTPDGFNGRCINLKSCKSLTNLLKKPIQEQTVRDNLLLRYSNCDTQRSRKNEEVCCPYRTSKPVAVVSSSCLTFDGQIGLCMNIQSCPALNKMLEEPVNLGILATIAKSRCESLETHVVCCNKRLLNTYLTASFSSFGNDDDNSPYNSCSPSITPPEPQSYCCGDQGTNDDRIVGGVETSIDEYPWLALIEYRSIQTSIIEIGCGGSLISGKYVLTAAHCLSGSIVKNRVPVHVRLGEYDLSNDGADCVPTDGGGEDCTNGALVIPIEKIFMHEQYNIDNNKQNDIALIRLSKMAPYTDFIRPICLPTSDLKQNFKLQGQRLHASGWGMTESFEYLSSIKREVDLPYVDLDECQDFYKMINITLSNNQMCAGGEMGKDACKGDSGGPLMYKNGALYEVTAVVSFGPNPCGQEIPSVYTYVYNYLPWIWEHITR